MRTPDYNRRVAVTGLGVISPVGNDKQTVWDNLVNGRSGLGEITRFDVSRYEAKAAGEVKDFNALDWLDAKAVRRSESSIHFGVAAAKQAVADSGFEIDDANRTEVGVVFGSGAGGQQLMIDSWRILQEKGPRAVPPTFIANGLVDSTSGMIAIETGAIGHNVCIVSACATGTHNVAEGAEAIRRGDCIAVICGSSRGAAPRGRPRRLRQHARARDATSRRSGPRDRLAAVRQDARRVRARRGRRRRCSSRTWSSRRRVARTSTPRSSATARRRRLGHDPADRGRRGFAPGR